MEIAPIRSALVACRENLLHWSEVTLVVMHTCQILLLLFGSKVSVLPASKDGEQLSRLFHLEPITFCENGLNGIVKPCRVCWYCTID